MSIAILLAAIAVNQIGTGIVYSTIPVRLAADTAPAWMVGLVSAAWSAGFLAACLTASRWIGRLGARGTIIAFSGLNAVAAGLLTLGSDIWLWSGSRCLAGVATGVIFGLYENWLGALATPSSRAVVFGLYMAVNRILFTAAQLLLAWIDPRWSGLFVVAALAYLLSPLPALALSLPTPQVGRRSLGSLLELPRMAPAAAIGSLMHGLLTTAGPSLFPIFGLAAGLTIERLAYVLAAIQLGGLLLQLPLTILSDRIGRRIVMTGIGVLTMLASAMFLAVPIDQLPVAIALAALWGGAPSALYAVAAAHSNDIADDSQRMAWSSSLMMNWGIGAALGPVAASLAMDHLGPGALFGFTGVLSAAFVIFLGWRKIVRKRPAERKPAGDIGRPPGT